MNVAITMFFALGCAPTYEPVPANQQSEPTQVTVEDALVQFSLVAALAAGDYSGGPSLREVLANGDFGIGTFSRLDGEMIVLDGTIYQALADGTLRTADLNDTAPFAAVTFFAEDGHFDLADEKFATLTALDERIDELLPHRNFPYAVRLEGDFAAITLRSVPAQSPPFQPLVDVVAHQVTWQHQNVRGVLVGLRCPAWVGKLNVLGYHWHFLSDDRTLGGHVLACELRSAELLYDECTSLVIRLPQSREFEEFDASEIDDQDIDKIERQRASGARP
jgi:acetolactate decarboxylase